MKVIGHHNKLAQQVFLSIQVVEQNFNEKPCHALGLKKTLLAVTGRLNEIATLTRVAPRGGEAIEHTPAAQSRSLWLELYRSAARAAPPKGRYITQTRRFGICGQPRMQVRSPSQQRHSSGYQPGGNPAPPVYVLMQKDLCRDGIADEGEGSGCGSHQAYVSPRERE